MPAVFEENVNFQKLNFCIPAFGCSNTGITDSVRLLFLNAHNDARLSVAKGLEPNKCGTLPSAKNMYKLQWTAPLNSKHRTIFLLVQHPWDHLVVCRRIFKRDYNGITSSTDVAALVAQTLSTWWGKVRQYGSTDPENRYVDSNLYTFANMVHSKMTAIGCTYNVCGGTKLTITCLYDKIGYYTNGVMWENGTVCTSDSDCTTYPGSTCSGELCFKEIEVPDPGTNTMCPSNANMTDATRQKFPGYTQLPQVACRQWTRTGCTWWKCPKSFANAENGEHFLLSSPLQDLSLRHAPRVLRGCGRAYHSTF
ncbi:SCP-like protein [Cooperia oncophora]